MARELPREAAERLLSGASASPTPDGDRLAALLAAAAAPATAQELAGEQDALAAFRALPPLAGRRPLRRSIALKVAAVAAAAIAAGGVAVASASGILPNPFQPSDGTPGSNPPRPSGTATSSPGPDPSPTAQAGKEKHEATLIGLCQAWSTKPVRERGKALESQAFSGLVAAAGEAGNVAGYCMGLLATHRPEPATGLPSKAAHATASARPEPATGSHSKPAPDDRPAPTHTGGPGRKRIAAG